MIKKLKLITILISLLFVKFSFASNIPEYPVIFADKKQAKLIFVMSEKEIITIPALFGKTISNKLDIDVYNNKKRKFDGITPSGTFQIKKYFSSVLNEPILTFYIGEDKILGIHPLWMNNPKKDRVNRLKSKTPQDNRITNGCININSSFFYSILDRIPDNTVLKILDE